ncbi:unnamed protein product [Miscanthus lutarioriparius]|uniref:Uncharacterized protein n=1 Tax=Miscanthus lutarioriparius TaxID=422564 RepID=A0A811QJT8_9POAL|nr:unnamed protein product [Miscanthus lutarioriparius]
MCARHIYANWRKKYTDKKLQKKWWRCAKASSRTLFNLYRAYLAQETPEGAKYMMNTSPELWSRAFFRLGNNCDSVDNNMCESFNHSIMEARFYPVISMCEAIRQKLMVRIQENRTRAEKWTGQICPNIFKKLKMNIEMSGKCIVLWNGEDGFEVQERDDFIAPCFTKAAYMKTYQVAVKVQGKQDWQICCLEATTENNHCFQHFFWIECGQLLEIACLLSVIYHTQVPGWSTSRNIL